MNDIHTERVRANGDPGEPRPSAADASLDGMDEALRQRYRRILDHQLDPPGSRAKFVDRLARDNGWSPALATRVVFEYKRFMFLAATAEHTVTPSDAVDQAWHLHLTDSRNYWDGLCHRVIGRDIHHEPSRGGRAAVARLQSLYVATLNSYRRVFGEQPPADIWPPPAERFDRAHRYVRVDRQSAWILRKPRLGRWSLPLGLAPLPLLQGAAAPADGDSGSGAWVWLVWGIVWILLALRSDKHGGSRGYYDEEGRWVETPDDDGDACGGGCGGD